MSDFQDRFVEMALRKGHLDSDAVARAFEQLRQARADGRRISLPDLLAEQGALRHEQLVDIRRAMAQEGLHPRLGDCELLSRIGRGVTGVVYCARQTSLDRLVAVKLLATHLAFDPVFVERFLREARIAARVRHPNVVALFDVGRWQGIPYMVMEFVRGHSLEQTIAAGERLSEAQAIPILSQIARALEHADSCEIIHRDIKPGNILVTPEGIAKLGDLGLALAPGDVMEEGAGTPLYISPEQARNEPGLDIRSDIYSLGCTIFHAVSGRPPYEGGNAAETIRLHAEAPIPELPRVSPAFSAIVRRMMAKAPEDRFNTAADLCAALEAIAAPPALPTGRTWPWAVALAVMLTAIAALIVLLIWLLRR